MRLHVLSSRLLPSLMIVLTLTGRVVTAQDPAVTKPLSMAEALQVLSQEGRPCLLVMTSAANARSKVALAELAGALSAENITVADWPVDADPRFESKTLPRLALYRRGSSGPELAGQKNTQVEPTSTLIWLRTLGILAQTTKVDPDLARTQYATPQAPPVAAPMAPFAVAPPPTALMALPQSVSMVNVPPAAPFAISVPSAPIVVTPSAPSVYVTPAPAPNVYVTTAPPSAPNVYLTQAAPQPAQLFVATPSAIAHAPTANVAYAPVAYSAAPQAMPQTSQVMILHSPGLIENLIGTVGEHMAKRKWPRVQVSSSPATTAVAQSVAYHAGPQSIQMSPQPALVNPPIVPAPPMASPQGTQVPEARHGWFHKRQP